MTIVNRPAESEAHYSGRDFLIGSNAKQIDAHLLTRYGRVLRQHPWQLTKFEWSAEREAIRPCYAQERFTRHTASQMTTNAKRLEWLLYGVHDSARSRLAAAGAGEVTLSQDEVWELHDQIQTPINHRMVVEKALAEGQPVPDTVLTAYPDLQPIPTGMQSTLFENECNHEQPACRPRP